ncbi:MAG: hypothetical protein ACLFWD_05565 [Anaerolineales bacterium]
MPEISAGFKYGLMIVLVLAIALLGFSVFLHYAALDMVGFAGSGLLVLAVAAGTASFFSPCSFSLLATLLARETRSESASSRPIGRALKFAAGLAVGVSAFLLLVGGLIALGAGPVIRQITFTSTAGRILRTVIGGLLILLGLVQSRGLRIKAADRIKRPLHELQARLRRKSPLQGFSFCGFGYVLTGFG